MPSKITVDMTYSKKKLPKNGLIPNTLKLLMLEGCNGYYDKDNAFIPFDNEQTFEVLEARYVDSKSPAQRVFCVKINNTLIPIEIQGTRSDRVLVEALSKPIASSDLIFRFLRKPHTEESIQGGVLDSLRKTKVHPTRPAPKTREWIPQLKQFVKIKGGEDLYIITDYDAYKSVFIIAFADARLAKHRSNQSQYLEVYPLDLEPVVLTY